VAEAVSGEGQLPADGHIPVIKKQALEEEGDDQHHD
jgi:hypothetical protein